MWKHQTLAQSPEYLHTHHSNIMIASVLLKELQLCWGFARRDLGIGTLPVPLFTMASLLFKNTPAKEMVRPIAAAFVYGIFYLYSFVVANQIAGVEEDMINKPDRPLHLAPHRFKQRLSDIISSPRCTSPTRIFSDWRSTLFSGSRPRTRTTSSGLPPSGRRRTCVWALVR
ncbi:hypothetical protein BDZ89DRAFT_1203674 [Hymenopellis radicata]|nr:hypothetical protein BDZ89DRAFT_1203674 [Hymenopellis radicata]